MNLSARSGRIQLQSCRLCEKFIGTVLRETDRCVGCHDIFCPIPLGPSYQIHFGKKWRAKHESLKQVCLLPSIFCYWFSTEALRCNRQRVSVIESLSPSHGKAQPGTHTSSRSFDITSMSPVPRSVCVPETGLLSGTRGFGLLIPISEYQCS